MIEDIRKNVSILLCGGVGSGKSTVLQLLQEEYAMQVLETDKLAHALLKQGEAGYQMYLDLLGTDILLANGELDRQKIANRIFYDREIRTTVNERLHPMVWEEVVIRVDSFLHTSTQQGKEVSMLLVESALLPNETVQALFDLKLYLFSPMTLRMERLRQSRGYSEEKIHAIIATQPSHAQYLQFCDIAIENDGHIDTLRARLRKLFDKFQEKK